MKINTKQFGELYISFRHNQGDSAIELARALVDLNGGDTTKANEDLTTINRIISNPKLSLFIDVGDRYTIAKIKSVNDNEPLGQDIFEGYAWVAPGDPYNKEYGRKLSLERAIQELPGVTDRTQREIFAGYYNR